ncbi:hypothetical protein HXX76_010115 [Chlamydomonas incerta]|uniref:Protein LHCP TRANSLOCATION DEFECT n=1 Tax=Chlamydomonas incerta TaxID=51695 RepID=A0A835SNW4_CHLIN|nr:hypothetical protein HXX76_010115 [Chlamydomonas incerta]|eukprot:KAG2430597.1 hypothetical protein HXX76_010115 [Chlamydomonas incerta]
MQRIALASRACATVARTVRPARQCVAARHISGARFAPVARNVTANFFKFGKNGFDSEAAGIVGSQGRDEYTYDDVEQYFNYMGFLATEGTYDRMEALLNSGLHPIDVILLLACSENDTPKVQEILKAGADPTVKGIDGKQPLELAAKPELIRMIQEALASKSGVAA